MSDDIIKRSDAIKAIENLHDYYNGFSDTYDKACIIGVLEEVPSAQSVNYGSTNIIDEQDTICGYSIKHLVMIANVMRIKNVSPEKVIQILTDVGEVRAMCRAEFEESLRKAVEKCLT